MTFEVFYKIELTAIVSVPPEDLPNDDDWPDKMPELLEKAIRERHPDLIDVELLNYN